MDIVRTGRKRKHLNTSEKYYICKISRDELRMSDIYNDKHDYMFQRLQELHVR
jgi:hypothetical protein